MKIPKTYFMAILISIIFALSIFTVINDYNQKIDIISIENEIEQIRIDNSIPSIQVSIVSNNKLIWTGQFGDGEENSSYMIGSVQKILTSIAILQLVEKGLIEDINDDINLYLPFQINNSKNKNIPVTFKLLLSHRSGLTKELPYQFFRDTEALAYPNYRVIYNAQVLTMTTEEYFRETLQENGSLYYSTNWIDSPNNRYLYSPSGYVLLKYLIEEITNTSVAEYMEENIFSPLQLENTGFKPINQVLPYTMKNGELHQLPVWTGKYMVRSTSSDMAKIMLVLMNNGKYQGQQILQKKSVILMKTANLDWSKSQSLSIFDLENFQLKSNGYGLAWERYSAGITGHGGSVPGFQTYFLCKEGLITKNGIILMMNVNTIFGTKDDVNLVFSQFVKMRNLLLIKTGMVTTTNLIFTYLLSIKDIIFLVIPFAVINPIIWKKRAIHKPESNFMLKFGYIMSLWLYIFIGLITVNEKNNTLELLGLCTLIGSLVLLITAERKIMQYEKNISEMDNQNDYKRVETKSYDYLRNLQYAGLIMFSFTSLFIIQNMEFAILSLFSIIFVIVMIKRT